MDSPGEEIFLLASKFPERVVLQGLLILIASLVLWKHAQLRKLLNSVISTPINIYLSWKYPIQSADRSVDIPTCPFRFPNGQGNIKFSEGRVRSREWAGQFGQIYRIWAGSTPEVVLTRHDQMPAVFRDSHLHIKSTNFDAGWLFGELVGKALGLLNGGDWNRVRNIFAPPFHQAKVCNFLPVMERRVQQCLQELHDNPKVHRDGVLIINPAEDLRLVSFWVLCDILYGHMSPEMEAKLLGIVEIREKVWAGVTAGGLSRLSIGRFLPTPTKQALKTFRAKWAGFNRQAAERARRLFDGLPPVCAFFSAVDSGELSEPEMLDTMDEILFANLDVTIGSLSWVLVFLAAHVDVQEDLRREIGDVKSRDSPVAWNEYISRSSTLLMACLLESARLRPIASFSGAQSPPSDRQVDQYVLPAGTNVTVDIHALNNDDQAWGDDRHQFNPQRFLQAKNPSEFRYRLWRFGFGPRQCLGKYLADLFLKTLLSHIVENYSIRMKDSSKRSTNDLKGNSGAWINLAAEGVVWVKVTS